MDVQETEIEHAEAAYGEMRSALLSRATSESQRALARLQQDWTAVERAEFCARAITEETSVCVRLAKIFAAAEHDSLLAIIAAYAGRPEPSVREAARKALADVPPYLASAHIASVLKQPIPAERVWACQTLGRGGDVTARAHLLNPLNDPEAVVVLAALESLTILKAYEATALVSPLITHDDARVREQAIGWLATFAPRREFSHTAIIERLDRDPVPGVRSAAGWALSKRASPAGRRALLAHVSADLAEEVRVVAATALAEYPDRTVARALLEALTRTRFHTVSLACKRTLDIFGAKIMMPIFRELMVSEDAGLRLEIAALLGILAFNGSEALLLEWLAEEQSVVVRASILEALSAGEWTDAAWQPMRDSTAEELLVAYTACAALGEMLTAARLEDFARLLETTTDPLLHEAILQRLCNFGRAQGLPPTLLPRLRECLTSETPTLVILAATALGLAGDEDEIRLLLTTAQTRTEPTFSRTVARAIGRILGGDVARLTALAGAERLAAVASVLPHLGDDHADNPQACLVLAGYAHEKLPAASAALQQFAIVYPQAVGAALAEASPACVVAIVEAWCALPMIAQKRIRIDQIAPASVPDPAVRRIILSAINNTSSPQVIPQLVDLSSQENDASVRQSAREALQRIIGSEVSSDAY